MVDRDLHPAGSTMRVAYSNTGSTGTGHVQHHPDATFHTDGLISTGHTAALPVVVKAREVQVIVRG